MKLLIDASNIIRGGGVTHLVSILNIISDEELIVLGYKRITILGVQDVLHKIRDSAVYDKVVMVSCSNSLLKRRWWLFKFFKKLLNDGDFDLVFNPGGAFFSKSIPYVTMCRNMLVFEKEESNRFGFGLNFFRFKILRILQTRSIKNAKSVIFISNYAKTYLAKKYKLFGENSVIINHGVSEVFSRPVKKVRSIEDCNSKNPFKFLYVSIIDVYKHQANIAKAVIELSKEFNLPISLTLIGPKAGGFKELEPLLKNELIQFKESLPHDKLSVEYERSDAFIYGSTCENMPNILIEAMSSGLPILSSDKMPMPEFLENSALYFNPLDISSIKEVIRTSLNDSSALLEKANMSKSLSQKYDWESCSLKTFNHLIDLC
ncbi:glycosyltransferase family 4 protein [Dokdonia donghaensis]|uniref:Glycosyl transferase family 1 domain-containing protein n=1 Tax=Dokdonia donghaensis DSW-1 TaxID=1300343 RepID=A0A0A2GR37_9FLAO|nr:glycosyltransferase family 1 protein [Dokdonia donghaensis]ANH61083.1 UDP-D-galactose:(glucosyl)lipopolysaccharide-1,6-D-galactosyltransferase [Dokdonia donghaensis DSW-1]KGO05697.1 hypothetical protein NV36_01745 [Dokdonia donghaensis DSW-1]